MKTADEFRDLMGVSTIKGFERSALRQDIYDRVFLDEPEHPYSTVMMSKKERFASTHLWYQRLAKFMLYDVGTKTNMSFSEFLKQPTWLVERTFEILANQSKETRRGSNLMQKDLADLDKEAMASFNNMKMR